MVVYTVAAILAIALAGALLAMVAMFSGHLRRPHGARLQRVLRVIEQHLNAKGPTPKLLQRLDRMDGRP